MNSVATFLNKIGLSSTLMLILLLDIVLTALSFVCSYFLCSFLVPGLNINMMLVQLPLIISASSLIFILIGSYRGFIKYDRVKDVYHIFNAICLANILTIVVIVVNGKTVMIEDIKVPIYIIIVHSILSFMALVMARNFYKNLYNRFNRTNKANNKVIIIGSGRVIGQTISALKEFDATKKYIIVGFIDSDKDLNQYDFSLNFPIFLKEEINKTLLKNLNPSKIVVALPKTIHNEIDDLARMCESYGIEIEQATLETKELNVVKDLKINSIRKLATGNSFGRDNQGFELFNKAHFNDYQKILIFADTPSFDQTLIRQIHDLNPSTEFLVFGSNQTNLYEIVRTLNRLGYNNTAVKLISEITDELRNKLITSNKPDSIFITSKGVPLDLQSVNGNVKSTAEKRSTILLELLNRYSVEKSS